MSITIWQSLARQSKVMTQDAFRGISSLEDWQKVRPQRYREFVCSLGLDPWPELCDSKVEEVGTFSGEGYHARKIRFQFVRDCWGSAIIYYPSPLVAGKLPGILYVCGHHPIGTYSYQEHPIVWARRGYVCLIVDSIEQNDNTGEHHGFLTHGHEFWLSLGYTAAGGEVINSIRALDILASDPVVDPQRLGVTGVSGGGAQSLYVAALDERIKAVSTLCGICSPYDAISNRHLLQHCDCMFPLNIFGRDISEFAALIAPRAALFCFGDKDLLFHSEETSAMALRTRKIFELYGCLDRWKLTTVSCGHGDHPDFDISTQNWFDQHLAYEKRPLLARGKAEMPESITSVFNGKPPGQNRLALLPELLSPRGTISLPASIDEWAQIKREAIASLPIFSIDEPSAIMHLDKHWNARENIISSHRGSVGGVDIWLETMVPKGAGKKLILSISQGGEFAQHARARVVAAVDHRKVAIAGLEPRLSGNNYPEQQGSPFPAGACVMSPSTTLVRAMVLVGQTPVTMLMHDIRLTVEYLCNLEEFHEAELVLYGKGEVGIAALYVALTDERVTGLLMEQIPSSHAESAPILGILRIMDIPQAIGLLAPRKVALVTPGHGNWSWPTRAYQRLGCRENYLEASDLRTAFNHVLN